MAIKWEEDERRCFVAEIDDDVFLRIRPGYYAPDYFVSLTGNDPHECAFIEKLTATTPAEMKAEAVRETYRWMGRMRKLLKADMVREIAERVSKRDRDILDRLAKDD